VFHELARHLQTRRLIAGDSLSLDQDKSFYCVVEGTVQVFAQTDHPPGDQQGLWDDEDMNGYQLLNEVGSGGTLSSLFTILSLFTENVQMSWQDEYPHGLDAFDEEMPTIRRRTRRADSDVSQLDLLNTKSNRRHTPRRSSTSSTTSTVRSPGDSPTASPGSPPIMVGCPPTPRSRFPRQIHQGVVARATVDSTLAVIPAEAFRRLTKKFPKASSHIVQGILNSLYHMDSYSSLLVILTRFSRVTFNAAHEYLGLTSEVLRTEKAINDIACHPLPVSFYEGGGLQHLRQRFDGAASTTSGSSSDYFSIAQSPSRSPMTPLSKAKESSLTAAMEKINDKSVPSRPSIYQSRSQAVFVNSPRQTVQAGDLLVAKDNMNDGFHSLSRTLSIHGTPRVAQTSSNKEERKKSLRRWSMDDFDLREEVMSCIAKSIGLLQPPLSGSDSVEASPAMSSTDFRSSSVTSFSSPFSSLSLLDVGDDLSSMTGSSSVASSGNYMSGLNNEVEILFYPAGTILAKAGEMNTGARPSESLSRLSLTSNRFVLCYRRLSGYFSPHEATQQK
jgi:lysophospholipid hydrolase